MNLPWIIFWVVVYMVGISISLYFSSKKENTPREQLLGRMALCVGFVGMMGVFCTIPLPPGLFNK